MEEAAPVRDSGPGVSVAGLVRGPLFWAAGAALAGGIVGFAGTLRQAPLWDDYDAEPSAALTAAVMGHTGEALAFLSLAGVALLLRPAVGRAARWLLVAGLALVGLLFAAEAVGVASAVYWNTGSRWMGAVTSPFEDVERIAFWVIIVVPPFALLPAAAAAPLGRERRLAWALSGLWFLAVPFGFLGWWLFPPDPNAYVDPSTQSALVVLGWYPWGISLPEAALWTLLGVMLLRGARERAAETALRARERENLQAARRLYEAGLAKGDASVLDELVSEDFRDLRHGARGKLAMERAFAALWKTYPDLSVAFEDQKAEGDAVRTRLLLSGTDEGGVLWYPPTGRRATFAAEFTDSFSGGRLIEHSGRTNTDDLLHQLGLKRDPAANPTRQTDS